MATWTDLCYVRQTVCEMIGEDFYKDYGREITDHFQYEDIEENNIFTYCLNIALRDKTLFNYDFKDPFCNFLNESARPKMYWIKNTSSHVFPAQYTCSNCGNDELYKTPFCPQCGAMEVKE